MRSFAIILLFFLSTSALAQNEENPGYKDFALSAEIAGSFYSGAGVNLEFILPFGENISFLPKVGFGSFELLKFDPTAIIGGSFTYGKKEHKIALGSNYVSLENLGILSLEYRLLRSDTGFSLRTGAYMSFPEILFFPGVSFGKAF
jgi:hypothetical protein